MTDGPRRVAVLLDRARVPAIVRYGAVATLIGALQEISARPLAGDGDVMVYFILAWGVLWTLALRRLRCAAAPGRRASGVQAFLDASVVLIFIVIGVCAALVLQHRDSPAALGALEWVVSNWIFCTLIVHVARLWFGRRARR